MIATNNINHAIDSNKYIYQKMQVAQGPSNRAMMLNAYHTDKVQFYNDENAKKKAEKKKQNKIFTLLFAGVSCIAIATGVVASLIKGKGKNHINLARLKDLKFDPKKLGFDTDKIMQSKFMTGLMKKLEPIMNFGINFGTIRDDCARRLVEKTKGTKFEFINTGAEKFKKLYHKWAHDGAKESYEVASENLNNILEKHGITKKIADFDTFFNEARDVTTEKLTKGTTLTQDFFSKDANGKMRPFKVMKKELTEGIIADKRIRPLYDKYLIEDLPEEVLKNKEVGKALADYNTIVTSVIDKHRDTNIGNAISDAAGMITAVGGLGAAIATADSKEERKSTFLNLGLPILSTLGFMIYGNMKNIAGVTSMVMGFAFGEVTKVIAKIIDKATSPKDNKTTKA